MRNDLHQIPLTDSLHSREAKNDGFSGSDGQINIEGHVPGNDEDDEEDEEPGEEFRRTPCFQNPEQDIDEDVQMGPEKEGVKTRYGGRKHVRVHNNDISKNHSLQNIKYKSILYKTNYKMSYNFALSNFRGVDQSSFQARKRALENHELHCDNNLCDICVLAQQVKKYKWDPMNLQRYHQKYDLHEKSRNLKQKSVSFDKKVLFKPSLNSDLCLNLCNIYQACFFNISFRELRLIKTI